MKHAERALTASYPEVLCAAVGHAARLSRALAYDEEVSTPWSHEDLVLVGRAGEIDVFVEDLLSDWRHGRLSADAAASTLARYLENVHRAMAGCPPSEAVTRDCSLHALTEAISSFPPSTLSARSSELPTIVYSSRGARP